MSKFYELEEVYGDTNKAFEDLQLMNIKVIRALLYREIEIKDDTVTLESIGNLLELNDFERLGGVINKALGESMPEIEDDMGE